MRLITPVSSILLFLPLGSCHAQLNLGLDHFYDQFDLVHSRAVANGIKDFSRYINDIVRCLRPGGIAIMAEGDWRPYQADKTTLYPLASVDEEGGSWFGMICSGELDGDVFDLPLCTMLIRSQRHLGSWLDVAALSRKRIKSTVVSSTLSLSSNRPLPCSSLLAHGRPVRFYSRLHLWS